MAASGSRHEQRRPGRGCILFSPLSSCRHGRGQSLEDNPYRCQRSAACCLFIRAGTGLYQAALAPTGLRVGLSGEKQQAAAREINEIPTGIPPLQGTVSMLAGISAAASRLSVPSYEIKTFCCVILRYKQYCDTKCREILIPRSAAS